MDYNELLKATEQLHAETASASGHGPERESNPNPSAHAPMWAEHGPNPDPSAHAPMSW